MPTRDIKESCRRSPTLAMLSHGAERLFWRLTTYADDWGRMPADPSVVLGACMPRLLESGRVKFKDIGIWLDELERADLIRRYTSGGQTYAFFVTWKEHQRVRAKFSKYPAPSSAGICRQAPANASEEPVVTEDTGKTDSRYFLPPANGTGAGQEPTWGSPERLVELYNRLAPAELPRVILLSDDRRKKAKHCLRQCPERGFWERCFSELRASSLLRGLRPSPGHEHFRGDFDWLLNSDNAVKVAEGKYRDREEAHGHQMPAPGAGSAPTTSRARINDGWKDKPTGETTL